MTGRIAIDDTAPSIPGGRPAKAVVGEVFPVRAVVWREGHDAVAATLAVRGPGATRPTRIRMTPDPEPDVFNATFIPNTPGTWTFRIEGWSDPIATWRHAVEAKLAVGQSAADLANDLELGARLLERAAQALPKAKFEKLRAAAAALRSDEQLPARVAPAFGAEVAEILRTTPLRDLVTRGPQHCVAVERPRALFGSWYEFFPRSTGGRDAEGRPVHGTFATAAKELPRIAGMGFDVVYLPPIHPIGEVNRKGRNNSLVAEPGDVGSPWAIGSKDGGHDAVHPALGTEADFAEFVATAAELGLEVALDLALQCAPDHPWVREHPEWFTTLPDGTIAYAENPPKKYQDIYPVNFDNDPDGLYAEVLRIVRHWIGLGVKIFRVDNPHTKPADFWEWLIATVRKDDPDVVFLSEAFTRPARLYGLARRGFSQSYTYFTWRVAKWELTEFGNELAAKADEARPNLFVNTPDILHESLQHGGPGMFAIRAVLAATLSPTWGVYSGFELFEHQAVRPGSEEYLDSEKYELRPRDFAGALARGESLEPWLTRLNEIRRAHPALQQLRCLHFHHVDNDALIAYSKFDPVSGDAVLTIVNLNPFGPEEGFISVDLPAIGREWHDHPVVFDEVSGEEYHWGQTNWVRLDPARAVAHIIALPPVPAALRTPLAHRRSLR
ncbi:alpha-1,4-glucan--maltose-1-phosphate maltosyltransferase [Nocardia farcinica]|uniref:alpha-1,4-glucan--maltose-1-phosphate maltosyltransferase n=1 Tax=Nocardia farcinica TaxID=37329 RepID=UPI001893E3F5|nr:alpha-1,4-glucan--maltose-1-phosphate maltosyltransferase [Nocardia farcinica]MBF6258197.1 alpha-1,4-glucan--maltose-1-phosphate maltosyltransferase [Nocardia farcinica]MBF6376114.1 alpha-1,4-glucan--maltose-1-phosphate maltosyltransferase [Nocardia farcinica]MBF6385381.1 alpha-1,4-glucan--maltose-1-phosphate maltosyltransferase [Nocardia farcinica]MBF6575432.1 alpha-1,4-glucan--maltose-1-phosphate maltosyltransferase [Nocardia farcinica]